MQIMSVLFAVSLMLPATLPAQQTSEGFSDVPKTHWAYEAVTDLKQRGILIGYPPERTPSQRQEPSHKQTRISARPRNAHKYQIHRVTKRRSP
jgi:hypothetical protein